MVQGAFPSVPPLSVVVVPIGGQPYLVNCLSALVKQAAPLHGEIVVAYDERLGDVSSLRAQFSAVQFHSVGKRCTTEALRAHAVRRTRGSVVVLTEDHCTPDEKWCSRILEAHNSPHGGIGGAIEKSPGPDRLLNWAVYFFDLGHYQNPVPRGAARKLCECNVSYKRETLAKVAHLWESAFSVTAVNWALLAGGETLWLSPDIVVWHHRDFRFGPVLREASGWARSFASIRVAKSGPEKRLLYTALAFLLPPLLLGRMIANILRKRRHVAKFVLAFPVLVLLTLAWSWGEFIGYLSGRATTAPTTT